MPLVSRQPHFNQRVNDKCPAHTLPQMQGSPVYSHSDIDLHAGVHDCETGRRMIYNTSIDTLISYHNFYESHGKYEMI